MNLKKFNLFLLSVLLIILFFILPPNKRWLYSKILGGGNSLAWQMRHRDPDDRKIARFGFTYQVYMSAVKRITVPQNAIILLPPSKYLMEHLHMTRFVTDEPALFYYYTGINGVWANSPDVGRANWEIEARNDSSVVLKKLSNRRHFDSIIQVYKRYID